MRQTNQPPFFSLLQRFASVPKVLASVRQGGNSRSQDAMNMWLEDLTEDHFRVCLREVKTFDGKHDNLKVVSTFILPLGVMRNSERPLPRNYLISNFEISSTISHPQNASQ